MVEKPNEIIAIYYINELLFLYRSMRYDTLE